MSNFLLRSYQEADAEAIKQFGATIAGWRGANEIRLVAGDPAIAHLQCIDRSTTSVQRNGICDLYLTVEAQHRRQGIGSRLYLEALHFAEQCGAHTLHTGFSGEASDATAFFERRGWIEIGRDIGSQLELTEWNATRFAPECEKVQNQGIGLFAYSEAADTESNRRRLYALEMAARRHMAWDDALPQSQASFDYWQDDFAALNSKFVTVAEAERQWIGLHNGCDWGFTGVHPGWRGRGIALALKVHSLAAQQASGITTVQTENEARNAPMLAVNRRLGFVFGTPALTYEKRLD